MINGKRGLSYALGSNLCNPLQSLPCTFADIDRWETMGCHWKKIRPVSLNSVQVIHVYHTTVSVIPGKGQRVNLIVCRYLYRQNRNPNIDQPDHTCLFPKKLVLISDFYLCSIKWLFLIKMQNQYLIFEERSSIQNQIDRHDMLLIKLLAPKHHWPSLHMMKIQAIQFF